LTKLTPTMEGPALKMNWRMKEVLSMVKKREGLAA
jgi:hypothetical protein